MGPKTKELVVVLENIIVLLDQYGVDNWSKWMRESLKRINNSDFSGVTHLLGAYGGMGSFNDCVLVNCSPEQEKGSAPAKDNDKLNELSSRAYSLATEIKKEVERDEK